MLLVAVDFLKELKYISCNNALPDPFNLSNDLKWLWRGA
jgi:hypothetical protein